METKQYRDTRTGDIVTQFNILDIEYMQEVKEVKATDLMRSMGISVTEL